MKYNRDRDRYALFYSEDRKLGPIRIKGRIYPTLTEGGNGEILGLFTQLKMRYGFHLLRKQKALSRILEPKYCS